MWPLLVAAWPLVAYPQSSFLRGDSNGDRMLDISDALFSLGFPADPIDPDRGFGFDEYDRGSGEDTVDPPWAEDS